MSTQDLLRSIFTIVSILKRSLIKTSRFKISRSLHCTVILLKKEVGGEHVEYSRLYFCSSSTLSPSPTVLLFVLTFFRSLPKDYCKKDETIHKWKDIPSTFLRIYYHLQVYYLQLRRIYLFSQSIF